MVVLAVVGSLYVARSASAAPSIIFFQNYQTDKCIGISRNYAGDWDCTWGADQHWTRIFGTERTVNVTLRVTHNGAVYTHSGSLTFWQFANYQYDDQCLAVSTGGTSPGLQLRDFACAGDVSQNPDEWWADVYQPWSWLPSGVFYLVNYHSMLVAGVSAGSATNGQPVVQYTMLDHADQWWYLDGNP